MPTIPHDPDLSQGPALGQHPRGAAQKEVDGLPVEGTWRAHQVPLDGVRTNPEHLTQLEGWMRSYRPESCSTNTGG